MGLYTGLSRYREAYDYASEIPMDEAYASPFGTAQALVDCQLNDMALFEGALMDDINEVSAYNEGYEVVNEGVDFSGILNKIKELFKKLIAKIKGIFQAFLTKLMAAFKSGKDLVKSYKKDIVGYTNWKGFKLKNIKVPKTGGSFKGLSFSLSDAKLRKSNAKSRMEAYDDYDGNFYSIFTEATYKGKKMSPSAIAHDYIQDIDNAIKNNDRRAMTDVLADYQEFYRDLKPAQLQKVNAAIGRLKTAIQQSSGGQSTQTQTQQQQKPTQTQTQQQQKPKQTQTQQQQKPKQTQTQQQQKPKQTQTQQSSGGGTPIQKNRNIDNLYSFSKIFVNNSIGWVQDTNTEKNDASKVVGHGIFDKDKDADEIKDIILKDIECYNNISWDSFDDDWKELNWNDPEDYDGEDDIKSGSFFTSNTWIADALESGEKYIEAIKKENKETEKHINHIIDSINNFEKEMKKQMGVFKGTDASGDTKTGGVYTRFDIDNINLGDNKKQSSFASHGGSNPSGGKAEYSDPTHLNKQHGYYKIQFAVQRLQVISSNHQTVIVKINQSILKDWKDLVAQARAIWTKAAAWTKRSHKEESYEYFDAIYDVALQETYSNFDSLY